MLLDFGLLGAFFNVAAIFAPRISYWTSHLRAPAEPASRFASESLKDGAVLDYDFIISKSNRFKSDWLLVARVEVCVFLTLTD